MSEYILEYCGRAKSFTFSRYPSRGVRITLSNANKYYRLGSNLSREAIAYYRSLAPAVRIRKMATNEVTAESETPAQPVAKKPEPAQPKPVPVAETEPEPKPVAIEDTVSVVHEETKPAKVPEEKESDFIVNRELPESEEVITPDMSEQDLCEYVDMHYSEEEARAMAEKMGVNVKRLRSKDSVISRLVSERYQEVLETAVKQ